MHAGRRCLFDRPALQGHCRDSGQAVGRTRWSSSHFPKCPSCLIRQQPPISRIEIRRPILHARPYKAPAKEPTRGSRLLPAGITGGCGAYDSLVGTSWRVRTGSRGFRRTLGRPYEGDTYEQAEFSYWKRNPCQGYPKAASSFHSSWQRMPYDEAAGEQSSPITPDSNTVPART
jgi:hypothetical protein